MMLVSVMSFGWLLSVLSLLLLFFDPSFFLNQGVSEFLLVGDLTCFTDLPCALSLHWILYFICRLYYPFLSIYFLFILLCVSVGGGIGDLIIARPHAPQLPVLNLICVTYVSSLLWFIILFICHPLDYSCLRSSSASLSI